MEPIPEAEFEVLVGRALDQLPDELWARLENVAVVVEDAHPEDPDLLGLYEGVPQTDRWDYAGVLPDKISIFRLPLCALSADPDELVHEVKVTVVHELGHHVGIDHDVLEELGWD